jgi:hypothetical protein
MKYAILSLFLLFSPVLFGQTVTNNSYRTSTGEKVLRLETTLPVNIREAWEIFTTDEGLKKWIAPLAHIELKTGGYILTNYNKEKSLEDSSSIKLLIINYLEYNLLTLKVKLNNHFTKKVQQEDANLQEIIQFERTGPKKTKIISSMIGWGTGEDWEKTYDFFVKGNTYTYEELIKVFKK